MLRTAGLDRRTQVAFNVFAVATLALAAGVAGRTVAEYSSGIARAMGTAARQALWQTTIFADHASAALRSRWFPVVALGTALTAAACAIAYLLYRRSTHASAAAAMRETERAGQFSTFEWLPGRERVAWSQTPAFLEDKLGDRPFTAWGDILHAEDKASTLKAFQELTLAPCNYEVEFRVRNRDGSYRCVLLRATSVGRKRGRPAAVTGILIDLTEHCAAEEMVREAALELVVREFAGSLGDSLNNALAAIGNSIYLLQRDSQIPSAVKASLLEIAAAEVARLKQVSHNVLGLGEPFGIDRCHATFPALPRPDARS